MMDKQIVRKGPSQFSMSDFYNEHPEFRKKIRAKLPELPPDVMKAIKKAPGMTYTIVEAAGLGELEDTENFLAQGTDPNEASDEDGKTGLHCAAARGHEQVVKVLIAGRADVQPVDMRGNTPLHYAAAHGHASVVKLLLDAGASAAVANAKGNYPVDVARLNKKLVDPELMARLSAGTLQ
eukprot:gnl/TRDRNA2_/TRDRNA2_68259_c0_seq1.p1 gnl/TRDRNA2_/TRDRNA2_68259_c0~~gnl/TRDRNA2_/TRDRNA2_68259_c0_seq1.p1  ORF type:complete len:180 (+),score=47.69 gnl/TRDRNA2_/TRDRNA2_68259_c0_seq1:3-542(+)